MTAPVLLSSRQRAILEAMAEGQRLRWMWVAGSSLGAWRYLLGGKSVDGRSVHSLLLRGFVAHRDASWSRSWTAVELTDAGRRAVAAPEGDGS